MVSGGKRTNKGVDEEMKTAIVYYSKHHGNTKKVIRYYCRTRRCLANCMTETGTDIFRIDESVFGFLVIISPPIIDVLFVILMEFSIKFRTRHSRATISPFLKPQKIAK